MKYIIAFFCFCKLTCIVQSDAGNTLYHPRWDLITSYWEATTAPNCDVVYGNLYTKTTLRDDCTGACAAFSTCSSFTWIPQGNYCSFDLNIYK